MAPHPVRDNAIQIRRNVSRFGTGVTVLHSASDEIPLPRPDRLASLPNPALR